MKKKNLMFVCACLLMSHAVSAQSKGEEIQFHRHGSLQLQGGAAYTLGEAGFGDLVSPAVGVHGSYYFTPVWGLRAGVSGYESKGVWVNPLQVYKYNYLQGDIDVVVDLANCFKYNYKRVVNPYLFLGVGLNGAFGNDEAVAVNDGGHTLEYLWRDRQFNPVGRGGIGANIRLGGRVYFNLEVNANVLGDKYGQSGLGVQRVRRLGHQVGQDTQEGGRRSSRAGGSTRDTGKARTGDSEEGRTGSGESQSGKIAGECVLQT